MIIGLDLDGVVADYIGGLRVSLGKMRGEDGSTYTTDVHWDLREWNLQDGEYEKLHAYAVEENRIFSTISPLPGAVTGVQQLVDKGFRIRIITNRDTRPCDMTEAVRDTATWLHNHNIPYHDLCFIHPKADAKATIYVDDAPLKLAALQSAECRIVVFDQPWNRDFPTNSNSVPKSHRVDRVKSWDELVKFLVEAYLFYS